MRVAQTPQPACQPLPQGLGRVRFILGNVPSIFRHGVTEVDAARGAVARAFSVAAFTVRADDFQRSFLERYVRKYDAPFTSTTAPVENIESSEA